jgi:hypothetical protein
MLRGHRKSDGRASSSAMRAGAREGNELPHATVDGRDPRLLRGFEELHLRKGAMDARGGLLRERRSSSERRLRLRWWRPEPLASRPKPHPTRLPHVDALGVGSAMEVLWSGAHVCKRSSVIFVTDITATTRCRRDLSR